MHRTLQRTVFGISALLFALAVITGCNRTEEAPRSGKRIVLLTNSDSPFWDTARQGLQEADKELNLAASGMYAVVEVNDGSPDGQISKLRQLLTQTDVAGLAISALDADNAMVADLLKQFRDKGIPVVTVDADVNAERFKDAREFYIGTDNYAGGQALGIAAKALLENRQLTEGSYVQFVGRTGSDNARKRMDGFKDAVGEAYREADRMADHTDRSKALENVRNAIANHTDLVALVGIWSYNAPAIADVVEEKQVRDKMTVVTFDAEPLAIAKMAQGQIDAMVVQDPFQMGYLAVKILKALNENDEATINELFPNRSEPGGDVYTTGLKVVVPDEGTPVTADLFDSNTTTFMKLSEFQQWLKQYNLQGS